MTDGTPGWYLDKDDPALARWHDGTDWTEHTLVIADQEPGSEPPPPPPARGKSDAQLQRERVAAANEKRAAREAARAGGFPRWAPIAVAVVVGVLAAGAFAMLSGDDDDPTTLDTQGVSIEEALEVARDSGFPTQIGDARASGLIEDLCEAADRPARTATLSAELDRLPLQPGQLTDAIDALGEGAEAYCPDSAAGVRTAVSQLKRQAGGDDELATDTTFPSVDGGVVDGSSSTIPDGTATTKKPTATTKKPTTGTTAKPAPTTTAPPPTTTTTIVTNLRGSACGSAGATSQTKSGDPLVCRKSCYGGSSLRWDINEPCATVPTAPTTPAN
ncbi:MAG: DUF2510 domain-containing protein [Actinomycetota bacterium]|nr:DUF2510 domain-containing protein [Actinomycetota bacterium]